DRATGTEGGRDLPDQSVFPDLGPVAHALVLEHAPGNVRGQRFDARQAAQDRHTHFAEYLLDVVAALGHLRRRVAPLVAGRVVGIGSVVDVVATELGADVGGDVAGLQGEQVAGRQRI